MKLLRVLVMLAVAAQAHAQPRKDDMWGAGNDISNVQGGVSVQPTLPVAGKVPNTSAWKAVCNEHFRNLDSDNRRERESIERRIPVAERDRAWKSYVERRDRQSSACAETWPGEFDLARARSDVETARGSAGGDAATCSSHAIPVPAPCRDYIISLRIAKRGQGPYQSRFDVEGNLYVPPGETAGITFLDHSFQGVSSASRMDVVPVCIKFSQEAQSRGLRPGTSEWRVWAEGKVRDWYSRGRSTSSSPNHHNSCAFAGRG